MTAASDQRRAPRETPVVVRVAWRGSDTELLALMRRRADGAATALHDRFGRDINRLVWRLLGGDPEHDDVVHEVFEEVLRNVRKVREPEALSCWVSRVTVNTVRTEISRRRRRRARASSIDPEVTLASDDGHDARDLLARVYGMLEHLPPRERIPFVLRYIDGLQLCEVGALTGRSLATVKRRLARAERRFARLASRDPALAERLRRGHDKWSKHVTLD